MPMSTIQITSQGSTDELLQLINRPVPAALQSRYDVLAQKQRKHLTVDEHTELLQVIEQIEQFDAERVQQFSFYCSPQKTA